MPRTGRGFPRTLAAPAGRPRIMATPRPGAAHVRARSRRARPTRPARPRADGSRPLAATSVDGSSPRRSSRRCRSSRREFRTAWSSEEFRAEFAGLLGSYAGRPTPVTECHRLSERLGVRVLLKREDLTHTGSHKINNVLGQALLTRRMDKQRVIAETGAGQHGVATATAAALFGLDCTVFMGAVDVERQALNVWRMQLLGAEVVSVESGSATLKDAINEALRDWVATVETTHYCIGSVVGPHPYPWMVREFQRVVGDEARRQCRELLDGADPDVVVACVGGGSNAMGTFAGFLDTRLASRRRRGRRPRTRERPARRVGEPGRPGCAARRALALPAGRGRPDPRGALDQRGTRLPRRRSGARRARGDGPGRVPLRHRRRGARRLPAAGGNRGHRARARTRARDRVARARGGARRSARFDGAAHAVRSRATRTPRTSPSGSPARCSSEVGGAPQGSARRPGTSCSSRTSPAGSAPAGSTSCAPSPRAAPTRSRSASRSRIP